ncbi:MAG TPA: AIR carboxylase family protein [Chloroflexia bacterium]|nr:AIR carboxylase family protein [Chloroflexia bacterium]
MADTLVPIILGSKADLEHARSIAKVLDELGLTSEIRIASAHKATTFLLKMLGEYGSGSRSLVYITVAGRSNALSGVVDANVSSPVIACPPYSDRFGGMDILSSLRMPSGLGAVVVLEPEAAALAAAKMLSLADPSLIERVKTYQQRNSRKIEEDDAELR